MQRYEAGGRCTNPPVVRRSHSDCHEIRRDGCPSTERRVPYSGAGATPPLIVSQQEETRAGMDGKLALAVDNGGGLVLDQL